MIDFTFARLKPTTVAPSRSHGPCLRGVPSGVRPSNEDRHLRYEALCLFVVAEGMIGQTDNVVLLNLEPIDNPVRRLSTIILVEQANPNNVRRDSTPNVLTKARGVQEHAHIHLSARDRKRRRAQTLVAEARGGDAARQGAGGYFEVSPKFSRADAFRQSRSNTRATPAARCVPRPTDRRPSPGISGSRSPWSR